MTDPTGMVNSRQRRNRVAQELIPGMAQYNALADARRRRVASTPTKDLVVGSKQRRQRERDLLVQRRLAAQNRQ